MQFRKFFTVIVIMLATVLTSEACGANTSIAPTTPQATAKTGTTTSITTKSASPSTLSETVANVTPVPSSSEPIPTATPSTTPPVSSIEFSTYSTLSTKGTTVYYNYCAPCHGSTGQGANGPALWKPGGTLGRSDNAVFFANNAADMLDFISYFMPLYAPGSLSRSDYINVTCFLLIQSADVQPMDTFVENQLKNIILK